MRKTEKNKKTYDFFLFIPCMLTTQYERYQKYIHSFNKRNSLRDSKFGIFTSSVLVFKIVGALNLLKWN
jgi:hypothetical protein